MGSEYHRPVMPREVLRMLAPRSGGVYLDATVGGGGHARLILEASAPDGFLVGMDRDAEALAAAQEVLASFRGRFRLVQGSFSEMENALREAGKTACDGILMDLGVSSHQLDEGRRGFSFMRNAPLDMRMDCRQEMTAREAVNTLSGEELERIFREYGEERFARRIARRLVEARCNAPLNTTQELADLVREEVPGKGEGQRIHPATRVFQALRIFVNDELGQLREGLEAAVNCLAPEGCLAVLTYHSLEARVVKEIFHREATGCVCPASFPVCVCHHVPRLALAGSGVKPEAQEVADNPRARSAVLRGARRLRE